MHLAVAMAMVLFLWPAPASANAGLPMLAVTWPMAFLALPVVTLVEMQVIRRALSAERGTAWRSCALANLASTFLGMPMTWGALVMLEIAADAHIPGLFSASEGAGTMQQVLVTAVTAPWLSPIGGENWMVPFASLLLLAPFLVASYVVECWVVRSHFATLDTKVVDRAVWRANVVTYSGLAVLVSVWLVLTVMGVA